MKSRRIAALLTVFAILLSLSPALADDDIEYVKSRLPKLLGSTNVGNDYWFTVPPCYDEAGGGHDNFIKIVVTSMFETMVEVEVPGKEFMAQKMSIPNGVIEFNITPALGQCYTRSPNQPSLAEQVYSGYGVHLHSDEPIIAYCVVRYYATSEGFLLIPVPSLGNEYIIASYGDMGAMYNGRYPCLSGIVAAFDDTEVKFTLGGNNLTQTGGGLNPGDTVSELLHKGDVWMFSSDNDEGDLTGSKIQATKPVAVVSGNFCTNIPTTNRWCDYTAEMDMPTYTWGLDYHVAAVPDRLRPPIVRIFAKEAGTQVYRNGNSIGYIQNPGGIISEGYLEMRLTEYEDDPEPAVISGDKPINVVLYNTGVEEDGYPLPNSDPFITVQTPDANHYNEVTFCTPGIYGGYGFNENYITLVYETDESGEIPDDMEYTLLSEAEVVWDKVSSAFEHEKKVFPDSQANKTYASATIRLPKDAMYKIRAEKPFAAYSFGYSWCDSYGYPTGNIYIDPTSEIVDDEPPVISWAGTDPDIISGTATDNTAINAVFFHISVSENCTFTYDEFLPGETESVNWEMKITDPDISAKAIVTFADNRGNDTTVKIKHYIDSLVFADEEFDYGIVDLGKVYEFEYTLINKSVGKTSHIENIAFEFANRGFSIEAPEMPLDLPPQGSVNFKVQFMSENPGYFNDNILVEGQEGTLLSETISAQASDIYQPEIVVSDVDFGPVTIGDTATQEFTISNVGDDDLFVYSYNIPNNSIFTTDLPVLDEDNILTIGPHENLTFTITAVPEIAGSIEDSIEFTSNATETDKVCSISLTAKKSKVKKVYVSDVDFEDVDGLSKTTKDFFIRNAGAVAITVNGYTGPTHDFISVSGPYLPAEIEVSGQIDFTVTIEPPDLNIPGFRDTIYFDTDAAEGDTMLVISAVVKSGISDGKAYDYGITLYPLPANDYVTIQNSDEFYGKTMLKVNDIEGRTLIRREIVLNPGDKFKLDVSGLSTGSYILQMEAGGKIYAGNITIER